ncbi:MAG: aminoglycoside 3'-phosphotransferase [Clostridia bacterium]|nr:aminoglycoside 3'-phosphotransferase [Clostridia bacterium]
MNFPEEIARLIGSAPLHDCSGRSAAQTFRTANGLYLKIGDAGTLAKQASMSAFLAEHHMAAEVLAYVSADRDYMLTRSLPGADGTAPEHLADPRRLCRTLAQSLRALHELPKDGCPRRDVNGEALTFIGESVTPNPDYIDCLALGGLTFPDPQTFAECCQRTLKNDAVIHGDACLPNIMMKDFAFTGFIDVGDGGIGDRHFDLFWSIWSLAHNLHTDEWREYFLDCYGRDAIDNERLKLCGILSSL